MAKTVQDLILEELKDIKDDVKEIRKDMTALKIKVGTISLVAGFCAAMFHKYIMGVFK